MTLYRVEDETTGKPRLLTERCSTCIMRSDSPVRRSLSAERMAELLGNDTYVVCHSTFPGMSDVKPALCRGAADTMRSNMVRIWARLRGGYPDGFTLVEPPSKVERLR